MGHIINSESFNEMLHTHMNARMHRYIGMYVLCMNETKWKVNHARRFNIHYHT